jgi:predicted enzyme related to lactoylglutathione lyase
MVDTITWFEIPATDVERAVDFYETVLEREIDVERMEQGPYAMFRTDEGEIGGAIARADEYQFDDGSFSMTPGDAGPTVYLTVSDVDDALSRVAPAGGEVLVGRQPIETGGQYGVIRDPEGNRVGLMSAE